MSCHTDTNEITKGTIYICTVNSNLKGPFTPTFLNRFEIDSNPNEANVNSHKRSENEFDPI